MPSAILAPNLSTLTSISHGFFTREGGVSAGIYAGLNCGLGSSDEQALVIENRRRVAAHLGGNSDGVVTLYQVHGATALNVTDPISRDALPKADAIVTSTPGLVIGVLTADCAPVLLCDPKTKIAACAHAGWRGAVAGILESTISEMERQGAKRSRIITALGPCIHQAAYEVGEQFRDELVSINAGNSRFFATSAGSLKPHFDLPGYVLHRLEEAGIANIAHAAHCTHANESLFYSYRRSTQRLEPDYGRQISAIVVA